MVREAPVFDVFLSHSSLDDDLCDIIKSLLEGCGLQVFATPSSIPTGKWEEQIEEALQRARSIWVLLTPNALAKSVWAHHEFGYYYGFLHGRSSFLETVDRRGHTCRFFYSDPSALRGPYAHIQGLRVKSFDDPIPLAEVIASSFGKKLVLPKELDVVVLSDLEREILSLFKKGPLEVGIVYQRSRQSEPILKQVLEHLVMRGLLSLKYKPQSPVIDQEH